ncbi:hypothetical protein ACC692_37290, partial [Rhizobium ruizarguesonis]
GSVFEFELCDLEVYPISECFGLEDTARSYGLTEATRYVTDLEILTGFETEQEIEDDEKRTRTTDQVELEFAIPIFDTGKARMRKAEVA